MPNKPPLPADTRAVAYVESEVTAWIKARIRGEEWTPGPIPDHPNLIRKSEVVRRCALSDVTIWKLEGLGKFPARVKLTAGYGLTSGTPSSAPAVAEAGDNARERAAANVVPVTGLVRRRRAEETAQ